MNNGTLDKMFSTAKSKILNFWLLITKPSPRLEDIGLRRRSRLLSSFLLLATLTFLITVAIRFSTFPGYSSYLPQIAINTSVTIIVYLLSRSRFYIVAAIMATLIVPIAVLNNIFYRPTISEIEISILMLVLGLLISIMLLPAWGTVLFSFINIISILLLPLLMPDVIHGLSEINRPLSINLIAAILAVIGLYNRNQIENQRRENLSQVADELQHEVAERKRAEAGLRERATRLELITEIIQTTTAIMGTDELLQRAVDIIGGKFGYTNVNILLVEGDEIVLRSATLPDLKALIGKLKLRIGSEGVTGWVAGNGEPCLVQDINKDPRFYAKVPEMNVQSELAVPIQFKDLVVGVLDAQSTSPGYFTDDDLYTLQTIADQLAIVIDNVRLVDEIQQRSMEMSALYDAALVTSSVLDTHTLLDRLYEQVNHLIAPDTFMVALYNPKDNKFSIAFAMENDQPVVEFLNEIYTLQEGGLTGWLLENRKPLLIGDIDVDPLPIEPIRGEKSVHAWLGVPLISRSNLIGAVSIQSFSPNVFDITHQRFLESLAAQSAVALENARLFEAEHTAREQAETLQEVAQVVGASLDQEMVLELILGQLKRVLTFDSASLVTFDAQGQPTSTTVIGYNDDAAVQNQAGKYLEVSKILTKMADDLLPIIIPDVRQNPDWIWIPGAEHVRSFLGIPVIIRDKMIGALMVDSRETDLYADEELNTVEALARHIAVAIENVNLFNAERIARENAEALRDAAQVIGSTLSLDEVIDSVLGQLARVLPYDTACVIMVEEKHAQILAGRGYEKFANAGELGLTTFPLDSAVVMEIVNNGNPLLIPDVLEYPGWIQTPFSRHIRSYLGVPLRSRDVVIGFFSLDRVIPNSFTEADLEIGQVFAAQTSAAIENIRLFQAEEKRATELEILRQVSLGLTASLEPESVFDAILNGVFALFPDVQDAHIFTYDGQRITFGAALWQDGQRGELFSEPREDGLTYAAAQTGETIVVDDFKSHPLFAEKVLSEDWNGSIVGIPVKIRARVVGVLNVAHQKIQAFTGAELRMLRLLADQAALAIENARLFNQTMTERRHLSLLYDVGQSLAISLEPGTIREHALKLTCQALEGNVGAIWNLDSDARLMSLKAVYVQRILPTEEFGTDTDIRLDGEETIVGWSAKNNSSIIVQDVLEDERWREISYINEEIRSMIAAPISDGQNILGVMTVLHSQSSAFTEDHLDLLQSICSQVGLALSNAKRYQDINRLVDLLADEQNRLEKLIEMLPVGILLIDKNQQLLVTNPLGSDFLSILTTIGDSGEITQLGDILLSDILESRNNQDPFEISINDPKPYFFEAQVIQIGGEAIQWVLTLRDITLERESQERIQMQDRLATVGQLAAGIAHDFNNIMAAIIVYTDLLMMENTLTDANQERVNIIQKQVERASSLIRQILDFSRRSVMEQSTLYLLPFMKEMKKLLERTLPETIRLELAWEEGEYLINADPTRLQQVFMNLAVNARDAMESGGILRFELDQMNIQDSDVPIVLDMPPGIWIRISVIDTGTGISLDNQSRIFEPFFTTKPVGQGTGLGLAQVYGIVRQHDGYIDVKSKLGHGTQFDIFLPALIAPPDDLVLIEYQGEMDGEGNTVLLVEDDNTTRSALKALLDANNFNVLLASNGTDALKILDKECDRIQFAVSDIVMPEMGGMDLYTIMQIRWPDIQMLFITGHPLENQDQEVLERGKVGWLQKPFSSNEFNQAVQNLLENQMEA